MHQPVSKSISVSIARWHNKENNAILISCLRGRPFNIQGGVGMVFTSELFILLCSATNQIIFYICFATNPIILFFLTEDQNPFFIFYWKSKQFYFFSKYHLIIHIYSIQLSDGQVLIIMLVGIHIGSCWGVIVRVVRKRAL